MLTSFVSDIFFILYVGYMKRIGVTDTIWRWDICIQHPPSLYYLLHTHNHLHLFHPVGAIEGVIIGISKITIADGTWYTHGRLKFTTGEVFRRLVVCKVHFMLLKGTYTYTIFHHIYGLYIISANLFSQIQMTNRLYNSLVIFHGTHHVYSLLWRKLSFGNGRKSSIT